MVAWNASPTLSPAEAGKAPRPSWIVKLIDVDFLGVLGVLAANFRFP